MRASPELMESLPPSGKRPRLKPDAIRELVEKVRAGYDSPANLEKTGTVWRLRLTINKPNGGSVRRGITVRDADTAEWIKNYLATARTGWRERCREEREKARAEVG